MKAIPHRRRSVDRVAARATYPEQRPRVPTPGIIEPLRAVELGVHSGLGMGRRGLLRYGPIRWIMAISALNTISYAVLLAAIPLWQVQSGQAKSLAGIYTVSMLSATVATQPLVPRLIGRHGTLRIQSCGLAALGVPGPLLCLSHRPEYDIALCLVRGAGFGVVTVVGGILGATLVPPNRHGESVGLTGATSSLASLVFLPAGVALTHAGHFDLAAWLGFAPVIGIGPAFLAHRYPRRALEFGGSRQQRRQAVRAVASVAVCLFVVTVAIGAVSGYLPVEAPTAQTATVGLLSLGVAALIGRSLVGRLVDRAGAAAVMPLATVLAAGGIAMVATGVSAHSNVADLAVIAGCFALGAGGGAVQTATMVSAFARVPQVNISTASAAWNFSYDIGTALGVSVMSLSAAVGLGIPGGYGVVGLTILLTVPIGRRSGHNVRGDESDLNSEASG